MHGLHVLGRHQAGAMVATAVDFTTMIALVSGVGLAPALGTAFGAAAGGTTNFMVGRRWIFRATDGRAGPQAGRYAVVSLASLLFNALGVHLLATVLHAQYVAARVVVAVAVSVFWNFPMHRGFVFGGRAQ